MTSSHRRLFSVAAPMLADAARQAIHHFGHPARVTPRAAAEKLYPRHFRDGPKGPDSESISPNIVDARGVALSSGELIPAERGAVRQDGRQSARLELAWRARSLLPRRGRSVHAGEKRSKVFARTRFYLSSANTRCSRTIGVRRPGAA